MPIQFPPQLRRPVQEQQWLKNLTKCFDAVPAPNMGRVGYQFGTNKQGQQSGYSLDPGIGVSPIRAVNVRRLSTMYQDPCQTAIINPVNIINALYDELVGFDRNLAEQNSKMEGISYDATGAALAGVDIHLFRSSDYSFVAATVSDGTGYWRFDGMSGGPFFIVEYLAGAPDRFGTSPNTLTEVNYPPGG